MKTKFIILIALLVLAISLPNIVNGSEIISFARWSNDTIILDNGHILRKIHYDHKIGSLTSELLILKEGERENDNFITERKNLEFVFFINGKQYTGNSGWKLQGIELAKDKYNGSGLVVKLRGPDPISDITVEVTYLLYPDLPVIHKYISFTNHGSKDFKLEALDIEHLVFPWRPVNNYVMTNYARDKHFSTYVGNWDDPLIVLHDMDGRRGIALGNETPGVLKRTAYNERNFDRSGPADCTIGLTRPGEDFAFRKWLVKDAKWVSPPVFITLYQDSDDPGAVVNGCVSDFVRKYMGSRLSNIDEKPTFVYNTWNPFKRDVNEKLIMELADAAAECGVEEFVIDDGWQGNPPVEVNGETKQSLFGDWQVNKEKFPNGLKPVFDYIKSKGMKPGLWMSIGTADIFSRIYHEHPEWMVKDAKGENTYLHHYSKQEFTACFATAWKDHIKSAILKLVNEHGLSYVKLDFGVVTSAYISDPDRSGCYAKNHPLHRDREESYLILYRRCMKLFDELHEEAPGLFIDCTFETTGRMHMFDYAFLKHAEGTWLSNIWDPYLFGELRARQLAWGRTPAIPATSLVIGNLGINRENFDFTFSSLIGTLPILLGDPRQLDEKQRARSKQWGMWLREMQEKYNYLLYRQDLPGFGEPAPESWDGWSKINKETKEGGIVGVFRQGAVENSRIITVRYLDPDQQYIIRRAPERNVLYQMSGEELANKGFKVVASDNFEGLIFEIEKLTN